MNTQSRTPPGADRLGRTVAETVTVGEGLITLLERETQLLGEMRVADALAMVTTKATLVARMRSCDAAIMKFPHDAVRRAGGDRLAAVLRRLDGAIRDNERAVGAAKLASERVVDIVKRAVAPQLAGPGRYGRTGKGQTARGGGAAVAVDTKL